MGEFWTIQGLAESVHLIVMHRGEKMKRIILSVLSTLTLVVVAVPVQADEYEYAISGTSGWTKTPYNAIAGKK